MACESDLQGCKLDIHLCVDKKIYCTGILEPVERKLGQTVSCVCKNSNSYIKIKHDLVYDVPLLRSLQQQLCDKHILKEVHYLHK